MLFTLIMDILIIVGG
nr:hypothetical protein [Streptococcus agalactiae]